MCCWLSTEFFLKLLVQSTAAMSTLSHQAALMVSATETGNCSHPSSCRLFVTIRATSLTLTWAGWGQFTTPEYSGTAHYTGGQSTLLQVTLSSRTAGTRASNIHSSSSLPTGHCKVWEPSASTAINQWRCSIIERTFGMMKARFCSIFLQALEVHHTFLTGKKTRP